MSTAALPSGSLDERLRARVRDQLIDILPDETIDQFIKQALDTFVNGRTELLNPHYPHQGTKRIPGELENIVEKEVVTVVGGAAVTRIQQKLEAYLSTNDGEALVEKTATGAIEGLTPTFVQGLVCGLVQPVMKGLVPLVVSQIQSEIHNGRIRLPHQY